MLSPLQGWRPGSLEGLEIHQERTGMSDNDAQGGPPGTAQADRLYRGFPDFSAWGSLSPEDADLWSRFAASLAERRQAATPEALKNAVEVAVRAAALDTGAIEGLYSV